jgi:hypothetical protein
MQELLKSLPEAKTKLEKQDLACKIISKLTEVLIELADLEQKYTQGLRQSIASEGSKAEGELMMQETEIYKELKVKKHLCDTAKMAIRVLNMYTRED